MAGRLNWLRAGVLGANDGIVSVAGIVVGVAGATTSWGPIFIAGLAGLVAGAVSMSLGEYVSVSSQRDAETAQLRQEKRELATMPDEEFVELVALYQAKGLSARTAEQVAVELTANDPLARISTPSCISPREHAQPATGSRRLRNRVHRRRDAPADCDPAAAAGLAGTSHHRRRAHRTGDHRRGLRAPRRRQPRRAVLRLVIGGALGLAVTYAIGSAFGTALD
jgi:VIT1/CCC1 family predicted Fe2+/Mn2+ transporter